MGYIISSLLFATALVYQIVDIVLRMPPRNKGNTLVFGILSSFCGLAGTVTMFITLLKEGVFG